ncbi:pectate lyase superfamily protein-domain-containing protein [Emericellopsis atlantica]|uniref:Pectate lyase superfamily protein-domain-containing protein n=1 Tax=Emericellopsis atlantica TaxID=2614577 RepID=A0A9P7ZFV4_9HYPO|nr:pectate lyase superfamily protein-domain-containing protein [Emericellopsis atlantica]KAG9251359.1 pectate lyase superfamily protein-domain-containing protein [Emericellopsis atlantica]
MKPCTTTLLRRCFFVLIHFGLIIGFLSLPTVDAHGHNAGRHHHGLHQSSRLERAVGNRSDNSSNVTSAEELIKDALEALKKRNKARVESPNFNKLEFEPHPPKRKLAAPLDYSNLNDTQKRDSSGDGLGQSRHADAKSYTLPDALKEAARLVAESAPQRPRGNHSEVATFMRQKYAPKNNDTNAPAPKKTPEGRLSVYGEDVTQKRAEAYWMTDMGSDGMSPMAPKGYKVWRNVKEYGAKGDGVTDDTAAINKAITEGGRCGANCGSSSIYPAVVYFPPGTYLVSSPLIQYFNTEFLGDPISVPTLLAASSFVGQGVIVSDVYVSDKEQWYLNTANFLRSIKNFKIDIRPADPFIYMCAIHWQVAQATSLENIEFYMLYDSDVPGNNQQGIYMENGSGGFLADLTFVGGNFGAYFGNQQFTTSQLVFVNAVHALQVHWDWAWTMQDFVIESCQQGLVIVGGAGGPMSTGQGVGSLVLLDSIIANTPKGIVTTLVNENSTSLLVQNVGFFNTEAAIVDESVSTPLLDGGDQVVVQSWGFGLINNATGADGQTQFSNGASIPTMIRKDALVGQAYDYQAPNLYTRRRPRYHELSTADVMNVKALGAKGDGVTDDTKVLNSILEGAANTSSVVYFPFGMYLVKDTVHVPVGSRIIGQAWSQIMGTGSKFEDETRPKPVVQVGKQGDVGIIEIQSMMFTVKGGTAGAIVVEWNVHQSSKGSAGLWDSHIRVGGAEGSDLSLANCPKGSGTIQHHCKAASMLMHLTPGSTAYIENAWLWTADHDLDQEDLDQIDIYAARGLLIESETAWLWGTSVEHNVLYQYQISNAENVVMGMIQTESPYFQPVPKAPQPFILGTFPNDPTFTSCITGSERGCAVSWAVRIINSASIYVLGAGLYSWFDDYSQDCLDTEDCQVRGFEIEDTSDIWIYNLCTKAIEEMISPVGGRATLARDNINGFLSSVLAWLQGTVNPAGQQKFEGYRIWTSESLESMHSLHLPATCSSALTEVIRCDNRTEVFQEPGLHSWLGSKEETDIVCDASCEESLSNWFQTVSVACDGYKISDALPTLLGGRIWAGYNETCLKDPETGKYCGEIIDNFQLVDTVQDMPESEMCSYCWIERYSMLQRSRYSLYDDFVKSQLEYSLDQCGKVADTEKPESPIDLPVRSDFCLSDNRYTTVEGDTCDSIALANSVSSAALYRENDEAILDCDNIAAATELCLPTPCGRTWRLQPDDSCTSIESNLTQTTYIFSHGFVRKYNRWIDVDCTNLHLASDAAFGHVLCVAPQNGQFQTNSTGYGGNTTPERATGYSSTISQRPENSTLAEGTTEYCGTWYVAKEGDLCREIAFESQTTIQIFMEVNPSLGTSIPGCSAQLQPGLTYCALPFSRWASLEAGG